jgi:hypothetical protein
MNARGILLRREGSNLRPSGYEPDELPLLYFAMWTANLRSYQLLAKLILNQANQWKLISIPINLLNLGPLH